MKEFLRQIPNDKVEINWNKNPIKMSLFLSFLTVTVDKQTGHFGECNGWTRRDGDNGLIISGGIVGGVDYLDSIKYGKNLDNPYNNFVNPFYLLEIMTEEGKKFFIDYYSVEINDELAKSKKIVKVAESKLNDAKQRSKGVTDFWVNLGVSS